MVWNRHRSNQSITMVNSHSFHAPTVESMGYQKPFIPCPDRRVYAAAIVAHCVGWMAGLPWGMVPTDDSFVTANPTAHAAGLGLGLGLQGLGARALGFGA